MGEKGQSHDDPRVSYGIGQLQSPPESNIDGEIPGTPDRVKLENDATSYTNSGHWTSILDGITELKDELNDITLTDQRSDPNRLGPSGPDLFFGCHQRHATQKELLAALPQRAEADEMLRIFFESTEMAPVMIHKPTFLRQVSDSSAYL
jgi:hypothetical protein